MKRPNNRIVCLLGSVSALAFAPGAIAQSSQSLPPTGVTPLTPPGSIPPTGPVDSDPAGVGEAPQAGTNEQGTPAAVAAANANGANDVVVTGSRVIQNGNNSPTPVTVVSTAQLLQVVPSNVQEGLLSLPILSGAQSGPQRQPGNSGGNSAAHTLNLRNIGTTRTLVLFDGRRLPPTSPAGEVNIDIVPNLLLQRVDVVTGGASAVYGSDAVTGVVNFVIDRKYNGLKIDALAGISERGDGSEQRLGIAGGMPILGDRGHIEGSYEFYNSPGIDTRLVRRFGQNVITVQGAGTTANPYRLVYNTRLSSTSFNGLIKSGPYAGQEFDQPGVLGPFVAGTPTGGNGVQSGGDGAYYDKASLLSLFRSHQAFGRFDYDLTDDIHLFAEGVGFWAHNRNNHQNNELPRNTVISATNAFLPQNIQNGLAAARVTTFTYSKLFQNLPVLQPDTRTRTLYGNIGLAGSLGDFKWEVSYLHAESRQTTSNNYNTNNQRLSAALDAVVGANGQIVCNVTITNPGLYPGCVPLNTFGPNVESQAAIDYIIQKTTYVANTKMDNAGASITGPLFSTWAGEVRAALSGEYRKITYDLTSNAQPAPANCTGLRFNCGPSTLQFASDVLGNRTPVFTEVKEGAIEVDVPILRDFVLADSLNINGAARYTDYNFSGGVTTWKVGVDWKVNGSITLRATRSRDIRAPSINELFAPTRIVPAGTVDLHTGVVGQAPFITSSNSALVPEVANTLTAGIVLRPEFLPRFSLSIDYYRIKIANAITTIQGQDPTIQGICEASNGTSSFCDLIQRPGPFSDRSAANTATAFLSRPQNAQQVKTNGVDFELNYAAPIAAGNFSVRGLVSYQPHLTTLQFTGAPLLDAADTAANAKWRAAVFAHYDNGPIAFDVQQRWNGSTQFNANRSLIYAEPRLRDAWYTNASATLTTGGGFSYFVSVRNLFDRQPTPYGVAGGSSGVPGLQGGYIPGEDILGRYFNFGVRIRR